MSEFQPYFPSLAINGQRRDFSHLDPFKLHVQSKAAGRILSVHVRFTTHCFTKSYDPVEHAGEPIILDEGKRQRSFCEVRFPLSLNLPEIVRGLNHPKAKVHQTGTRRNWVHSAVIPSPDGPYHVFFELRRAERSRRHLQDVELTVESAYPQLDRPAPIVLGKMGFQLLVGNVFLGRPVATSR